jgi:adenylate cyclase
MIALSSLTPSFQGLLPAWLCTCSRDGIPNVAMLSHVDYVDARHVALSFQFFNKSKRNIDENPRALVRVYDPDTLQMRELRVRYVRTECDGPTFERMRLRIEAIASHSGLKGIFKLLGADIYEVLSIHTLDYEVGRPAVAVEPAPPPPVAFTMTALQELSDRIQQAPGIDCLLDGILEKLEDIFGFRNSMILLTADRPDRLELVASRGYPEGGVGSEVGFGDGIIGMVAEARKPVRISGLMRHMLYAYAVAERARLHGLCPDDRRIPLPGLASPETQLGIPLLAQGELIGVLCIETDAQYRFHEDDRACVEVLGGYLAIAIQNALLRERSEDADDGACPAAAAPLADAAAAPAGGNELEVAFYAGDDCILVDGEYLVRGLPARILWKLLREHRADPAQEFTNRRLRLDKSLDLPVFKDNLESRLILLRRRLEERCPAIRLAPTGRGRFRVALAADVKLREVAPTGA